MKFNVFSDGKTNNMFFCATILLPVTKKYYIICFYELKKSKVKIDERKIHANTLH